MGYLLEYSGYILYMCISESLHFLTGGNSIFEQLNSINVLREESQNLPPKTGSINNFLHIHFLFYLAFHITHLKTLK